MKKIEDLTNEQGKEILKFVFPTKDYYFKNISFNPKFNDDKTGQFVTFNGRSIIGIEYHDDQDNCILHFDDTRVVLWLYKNNFDIIEQLETNKNMSQIEIDFDNMAFAIHWLSKVNEIVKEDLQKNLTTEYYIKECKRIYNDYYLKD